MFSIPYTQAKRSRKLVTEVSEVEVIRLHLVTISSRSVHLRCVNYEFWLDQDERKTSRTVHKWWPKGVKLIQSNLC